MPSACAVTQTSAVWENVATLESRTEGWIAALLGAALSMQGPDDVAAFIAAFAGDDRYIVNYLVEEVFARQPEPVGRLLLRSSILRRLRGPLCDAVTGQGGGTARLVALERANQRPQTSMAAPQMPQVSSCRRFHRATGTKNTVNCLNSRIRVHWVVL